MLTLKFIVVQCAYLQLNGLQESGSGSHFISDEGQLPLLSHAHIQVYTGFVRGPGISGYYQYFLIENAGNIPENVLL